MCFVDRLIESIGVTSSNSEEIKTSSTPRTQQPVEASATKFIHVQTHSSASILSEESQLTIVFCRRGILKWTYG